MYRIEISKEAEKQIRQLNKDEQVKIVKKIFSLQNEPRPVESKKLRGTHSLYRVRQGDYRIIYTIEDSKLTIIVLKVGHRGKVYKTL